MASPTPLTLEGLAAVLERHIEHTAEGFRQTRGQIEALTIRVDDLTGRIDQFTAQVEGLTGQVEGLVGLMREQGLRITILAEQQAEQQLQIREQQTQIRQILHRLEQHDARFEEQNTHIRRILDLLQHRGGDGASGTQ